VVVHDLYVAWTIGRPHKAHPPLVVDADAMLPLAPSRQSLQTIAGWRSQKVKRRRAVKHLQFPLCHRPEAGETLGFAGLDQLFRIIATESVDRLSVNDKRLSQFAPAVFEPLERYSEAR
jgi:hypothetical protein